MNLLNYFWKNHSLKLDKYQIPSSYSYDGCLAVCTATLLNKKIEEVPNFSQPRCDDLTFYTRFLKYLDSQHRDCIVVEKRPQYGYYISIVDCDSSPHAIIEKHNKVIIDSASQKHLLKYTKYYCYLIFKRRYLNRHINKKNRARLFTHKLIQIINNENNR